MQEGEFIVDRWIVKMLRELCQARDLSFASYSDDWLLEFTYEDKVHRVFGYRFDLNDSVAAHISQDKVASYQVLAKAQIPAVPHVLVRTKVSHADRQSMSGWQHVVIKPLNGAGGHGVQLFDDIAKAAEYIESSSLAAWAAAPFIDIAREIRVILLDDEPLLVYEKSPVVVDGLKMFNLGLGATPHGIDSSENIVRLARHAQQELGLRLSTVDIVEDNLGDMHVLEINDSIMMEYYARYSNANLKQAKMVYEQILDTVINSTAMSA